MITRYLVAIPAAVAALAVNPLGAQESHVSDLYWRISERLTDAELQLIDLRRDIHRHPEVSGEESRTAAVVAKRLGALGFTVTTDVGGHGVIGMLRGGKPGPTVAFRADMDAVRSDAPDPVEFRSVVPGVRHICGHDVHTTVGIALAEGFAAVQEELAGSVMLVFQPAEERATGARAMLADGVFASEKPAAIFAVHTAPFPVGQLATAPGGMMAGRDAVRVVIRGTGDLDEAVEAVARVIRSAGTIPPAQAMQSHPPSVVLAQVFSAVRGSSGEERHVRGQITTASDTARARARQVILQGIERIDLPGVHIDPAYESKAIAGVTNDPELVSRANASIRAVLGDESVVAVRSIPPAFSEDFGSFQAEVPGVMYFLGVSNPATGTVGMPHSPDYVADEGAIVLGARAMSAILLDWLAGR